MVSALGDDAVQFLVGVAALIGEGHAGRNAGLHENGGGDGRVAAEDGGFDRKIEIMVGIDGLLVGGAIGIHQFRIDADDGQCLTQVIAELLGLVEIGAARSFSLKRLPSAPFL